MKKEEYKPKEEYEEYEKRRAQAMKKKEYQEWLWDCPKCQETTKIGVSSKGSLEGVKFTVPCMVCRKTIFIPFDGFLYPNAEKLFWCRKYTKDTERSSSDFIEGTVISMEVSYPRDAHLPPPEFYGEGEKPSGYYWIDDDFVWHAPKKRKTPKNKTPAPKEKK